MDGIFTLPERRRAEMKIKPGQPHLLFTPVKLYAKRLYRNVPAVKNVKYEHTSVRTEFFLSILINSPKTMTSQSVY